jgi:uncharacterized RDD family membrane protein YckC
MAPHPLHYAGFRLRVLAFALDYLLIAVYLFCLLGLVRVFRPPLSWFRTPSRGELTGFLSVTLPVTLYFAVSEASNRHATWGKRKLHLRVTDAAGAGVSGLRSMLRNVVKFLPWELAHAAIWKMRFATQPETIMGTILLGLVWSLVIVNLISLLVSRKHQTLYDWLAGTVVIEAGIEKSR